MLIAISMVSCRTRVQPNHHGVLMENFGKDGKGDYSLVKGRVMDWGRSRQLWQVPAWEQRAKFDSVMHLESSDKTQFTCMPSYSYWIIENKAVDVVFKNAQLDNNNFLTALENNVLETKLYDVAKDISRKYSTDTLMATGGSMKYENEVRSIIEKKFDSIGVHLESFTLQPQPTKGIQDRIDDKNKLTAELAIVEMEIRKQEKKNELARKEKEYNEIQSQGYTPQILQIKFYEAWQKATVPLYGNTPFTLFKTIQ